MPIILVVEDDHLMLKAIGNILNRGGFNVHNAPNGKEALEMLESASYDVVITDLMMPHAGGLEIVSKIRADSSKKDTRVIVVSSMAQEEMITEAFNLGADDFLKKPVMAGDLVSRIHKLLRQPGQTAIVPDETMRYDIESEEENQEAAAIDVAAQADGEVQRYTIAIHKFIDDNTVKLVGEKDIRSSTAIELLDVPAPEHPFFPQTEAGNKRAFAKTFPELIRVGSTDLPVGDIKMRRYNKTYIIIGSLIAMTLMVIFMFMRTT